MATDRHYIDRIGQYLSSNNQEVTESFFSETLSNTKWHLV